MREAGNDLARMTLGEDVSLSKRQNRLRLPFHTESMLS